jgi:hypothetical protein
MTEDYRNLIALLPPPGRVRATRDGNVEGILLKVLAAGHSMVTAAKVACVARSTVRNWRRADSRFDELVVLAQQAGRLALSRERLARLISK